VPSLKLGAALRASFTFNVLEKDAEDAPLTTVHDANIDDALE
jgi:hypothetical protein